MLAVNGGNDVQLGWFRLRPPGDIRSLPIRRRRAIVQIASFAKQDLLGAELTMRPGPNPHDGPLSKMPFLLVAEPAIRPRSRDKCGRQLDSLVLSPILAIGHEGTQVLPNCWQPPAPSRVSRAVSLVREIEYPS